ncbi:HlyD family type I secretion periplasmic adaptor subunit [Methylocapsa sp. S129]|uniref:HlyD family type I secretion periplasmic adaptor subunit n=1 Tax=Methylocapsa sp. S129 TaxID=1641869 RepID=UPI001FEF5F07|nr:HlyD family type I secretion periplasmic adaptor subunit [Methylocapsa sp. S129]
MSVRSLTLGTRGRPGGRADEARDAAALDVIHQFESETATIERDPVPRWARVTILTLTAFLVCGIVIMSLTRIDRVVTSKDGKIVTTGQINVLQALDPSIIKSIDVGEGDEVRKGQVLGALDPTFAAADVRQLQLQVASLEAQAARDEAQLDDRPLTLPEAGADSELHRYGEVQRSYYEQQMAQYKAQLASFDAKIAQAQATMAKFGADESHFRDRQDIAQKIEDMRSILALHGTGSQLNLLNSQDQRMELARSLDFDHSSLVEAQHTLASLTADRAAFVQQWSTQLSQDLVATRNSLDLARSQFEKATKHKDLVRLTAGEPSVVLTIARLSVGSVLKEGDTLFTLMPTSAPVEAEVFISAQEIGFVRPGDRCVLKIAAFNYMEHGTASGTVRWISDNAFTTDDDGKPVEAYYKARCSADGLNFRNVPPKFRLIPGMTLEADLKVGTRSVAMYLLGGVMRGLNEAMREP